MHNHPVSCGVVITRCFNDERRYLLLRAYQFWDFPKGLKEDGEEPLQAAIREVEEESTLVDLQFQWGYDYRETPAYGRHRKIARYYIALCESGTVALPINPELGRPEHDEFRWVTFQDAMPLLSPRVQPVLKWAHDIITQSRNDV